VKDHTIFKLIIKKRNRKKYKIKKDNGQIKKNISISRIRKLFINILIKNIKLYHDIYIYRMKNIIYIYVHFYIYI